MTFSSTEQAILKKLSEGDSVKEIAKDLQLSVAKVTRTIYQMRMREQCRNALELVVKWLRYSLNTQPLAL